MLALKVIVLDAQDAGVHNGRTSLRILVAFAKNGGEKL